MLARKICDTKVGLDRLSKIITSNHYFPLEKKWSKWPNLWSMLERCRRRLNITAVHLFGNCLLAGAYIANENIPPLIEEDIEKVQLLYWASSLFL